MKIVVIKPRLFAGILRSIFGIKKIPTILSYIKGLTNVSPFALLYNLYPAILSQIS